MLALLAFMYEKSSFGLSETISALKKLGEDPQPDCWVEVMSTLNALISLNREDLLVELVQAARAETNPTAAQALDACFDLLFSEGPSSLGPHAEQWRAVAIGVLVPCPKGLAVSRLSDVHNVRKQVSQMTGLREEDVYIDNRLVSTRDAVRQGPLAVYTWSNLLRSRAGGLDLRFMDGMLTPFNETVRMSSDAMAEQEICEVLLGVGLRVKGDAFTEALVNISSRLPTIAQCKSISGGLELNMTFADFGVPWTLSRQFVHTHELLQLTTALDSNSLEEPTSVWVALLDDPGASPHLRIGVTNKQGKLLSGFDFPDMPGVDSFLTRVQALTKTLGKSYFVQPARHTHDLVQSKGRALFPVSDSGWRPL